MRLRWTMVAVVAVVLLAVAMLLRWGGVFDDRKLVIGVLNHAIVAEESLDGFKSGLGAYGYSEGGRVTYTPTLSDGEKSACAVIRDGFKSGP